MAKKSKKCDNIYTTLGIQGIIDGTHCLATPFDLMIAAESYDRIEKQIKRHRIKMAREIYKLSDRMTKLNAEEVEKV